MDLKLVQLEVITYMQITDKRKNSKTKVGLGQQASWLAMPNQIGGNLEIGRGTARNSGDFCARHLEHHGLGFEVSA